MSKVGQNEIKTQKRLIKLFQNTLGYEYLGDWKEREDNRNIEASMLTQWLTDQGHGPPLVNKVLQTGPSKRHRGSDPAL